MREVFKAELADRLPASRKAFAERLLREAAAATDKPADRYVLIVGAYESASDVQDVPLAFASSDALGAAFEVDTAALKLAALVVASRGTDPARARAAVTCGLELIDASIAAGDYDAARRAGAAIALAAPRTRDDSLAATARERAKEVQRLGDEFTRAMKDGETLRTQPADPAANLSVGRFYCFTKGDWARGLPLLARGGDTALKALAAAEVAAPSGIAQLKLADDWMSAAAREQPPIRSRIEAHALDHYRAVLDTLSGLEKIRIQKRMADIAPYSFTVGKAQAWSRGDAPIDMLPTANGFCAMTSIGGGFHGPGEDVRLSVGADAVWRLGGNALLEVNGGATSFAAPAPGMFQPPAEYQWKSGSPPTRMIAVRDGFCVFAGLVGAMRGPGEDARVYPGDDGYWYLAGRSNQNITFRAIAIKPTRPAAFRPTYAEHVWRAGDAKARMCKATEGFCFLSGVAGQYEGGGERVWVAVDEEGFWCLEGKSRQKSLIGRAMSVKLATGG